MKTSNISLSPPLNIFLRVTITCLIMAGISSLEALAQRRVYYVNHSTYHTWPGYLYRANATGSNRQNMWVPEQGGFITGIAVDRYPDATYFYVATQDPLLGGEIRRCSIDTGLCPDIIYYSGARSLFWPRCLVIEGPTGRLFFYEGNSDAIMSVQNIPGSQMSVVRSGVGGLNGLAVHTATHTLVYSTGNYTLESVGTDGTNHAVLAPNPTAGVTGAVAVDQSSNLVYWFARNGPFVGISGIYRMNLDGSGQQYFGAWSYWLLPIAVDDWSGQVYWLDGGTIYRMNRDGPGGQQTAFQFGYPPNTMDGDTIALEMNGFVNCKRTDLYADQPDISPGVIDIGDIARIVDCFKTVPATVGDPYLYCDVYPCSGSGSSAVCVGDGQVNISDVSREVDIFKGRPTECP